MNLNYISLQHVLYGPPSQNKLNFLNSRRQESAAKLGQYESAHTQQAVQLYDMFNSDEAIRRSKMLLSQTESVLNNDNIFVLNADNVNRVNTNMMRYIISEPKIYKQYLDQTIDGYSDKFINMNNHDDPYKRVDYLNITNGVYDSSSKEIKLNFMAKSEAVSSIDKLSIYKSWKAALAMIADDVDPTDI